MSKSSDDDDDDDDEEDNDGAAAPDAPPATATPVVDDVDVVDLVDNGWCVSVIIIIIIIGDMSDGIVDAVDDGKGSIIPLTLSLIIPSSPTTVTAPTFVQVLLAPAPAPAPAPEPGALTLAVGMGTACGPMLGVALMLTARLVLGNCINIDAVNPASPAAIEAEAFGADADAAAAVGEDEEDEVETDEEAMGVVEEEEDAVVDIDDGVWLDRECGSTGTCIIVNEGDRKEEAEEQ